jgi:hypothetical protein
MVAVFCLISKKRVDCPVNSEKKDFTRAVTKAVIKTNMKIFEMILIMIGAGVQRAICQKEGYLLLLTCIRIPHVSNIYCSPSDDDTCSKGI